MCQTLRLYLMSTGSEQRWEWEFSFSQASPVCILQIKDKRRTHLIFPSIVHSSVCVLSRSVMSNSLRIQGMQSPQAPLSMGLSRQEYQSKLPSPASGDPPSPGIEPASLRPPALVVESLPLSHPGSPSAALAGQKFRYSQNAWLNEMCEEK